MSINEILEELGKMTREERQQLRMQLDSEDAPVADPPLSGPQILDRPSSPLPRDVVTNLTGLEVMRRMLLGELPPPPVGATTRIYPVEVSAGCAVFDGEPSERFLNPDGKVHGGWIAMLLDSAMAWAVLSRLAAGQIYTTVQMQVHFVRPITANTGRVRCLGRVLHAGRRVATAEGRLTDQAGKLLAHRSETCLIMEATT
ncbi:MAG: PaaI family thioesterase [Chthoniobacterales bacterium]